MFLRRLMLSRLMLALVLASFAVDALAESPKSARASQPQTIPGLGTTSFVTSTRSPEAQTAFLRGLLLLHVFEYPSAAKSFQEAERLDRDFAMAYWGEAMTFNHGVWNAVDPAAGRAVLDKFAPSPADRVARVRDPRERAYLSAVEVLYDGTGTKTERDVRYAKAMERLSADYPGDHNAQLFYALALLSQNEGVRDVPAYLRAAEISQSIMRLEPQNPGAAHYWIHGMDDPDHAAGALEAARELSKIAPDAGHAQHMCSHIFLALGMWDDVVDANVAAMRVVNLQGQAAGLPLYNCGHYQEWLEYGYYQQGRMKEAQQTVDACARTGRESMDWVKAHPDQLYHGQKDPANIHKSLVNALVTHMDMAVIESQNWTAPQTELDSASMSPGAGASHDFTLGYAAAQRKDFAAAHAALQAMEAKLEVDRKDPATDPSDLEVLNIDHEELNGLIRVREGDFAAGCSQIRKAVQQYQSTPFAFGPPVTIKPPEELLGEVLLDKKDAAGARHAFEDALKRAPRRAQSLLGLARSEALAGDLGAARTTYKALLTIWHGADSDVAALQEARKAIALSAETKRRR